MRDIFTDLGIFKARDHRPENVFFGRGNRTKPWAGRFLRSVYVTGRVPNIH